MSALILFVFAVLMFIGSLTLPVSPDKLVFEFGALALLGTAAFRAHSFGAPGFAPSGAAMEEEPRKALKHVGAVFGLTAACCFVMFGVTSLTMSGKPSTPGSTTEPNSIHALVIAFGIYFAILGASVWRWARDTRDDRRVSRTRVAVIALMAVSIVAMVGHTVYLAPRLPAFRLGDGSGGL